MTLSRNRIAAGAVIAAAALLAAASTAGCDARTDRSDIGSTHVVAAAPTSHRTAPMRPAQRPSATQPAQATGTLLGVGQSGVLAQVPWEQVGPGWALADYTTGSNQLAQPVMLYMLDPEGGRYQVYTWAATTDPWMLISWSGDKTRVLLQEPGTGPITLHQLTIATGQLTTFTLPATVSRVLGYTSPDGENILADQNGIVRYSLTGVFQARLSQGGQFDSAVSAPDGLTEIVSGGSGVELVSNAGGMVRSLPVPGADSTEGGCTPVRWWTSADVLVSCMPSPGASMFSAARLWLVPVSGAAPTALTPQRAVGSPDFGDVDAWQLPTGLYLQAEAGCGPPFIAKELSGTALQVIGPASVVIATSGNRMLVQRYSECIPGSSLVWLDPAASGVQGVLTALPDSTGVASAIPFSGNGEQPPSRA